MKNIFNLVGITILIILLGLIVYIGYKGKQDDIPVSVSEVQVTEEEKFKEWYGINNNHYFNVVNKEEIIDVLETKTGVVFFGFPECHWCQKVAFVLNEVLNETGHKNAYYFNPREIRQNNTLEYQKILDILGDKTGYDEDGNKKLYIPNVYFIKNGEVISNHQGTVISDVDKASLTEEEEKDLKKIYINEINKLK